MKLSVANGQYDLKNEITADVNIKGLGDCNYALQVKIFEIFHMIFFDWIFLKLRNVKITETQDEDESTVTSSAQKELENLVVRFRWVDGFLIAVEADESAKVDHVNFIKGILSTLQVYSPVPSDGENIVRTHKRKNYYKRKFLFERFERKMYSVFVQHDINILKKVVQHKSIKIKI